MTSFERISSCEPRFLYCRILMSQLDHQWIYHVIVIWDETDHLSAKHSSRLAEDFWAGYFYAFPEARVCTETPGVIATGSPIFRADKVRSFLHEGVLIPHQGRNKDLAIAKFCSTGFIDQDDRFHFLLDDLRELRRQKDEPPMHANSAIAVVFVTSDMSTGMTEALDWVLSKSAANRTHFTCLRLDQAAAYGGGRRTVNAGLILGQEFRNRFVRIERGGLVLSLKNQPIQ